jgi:hypothetical protein
VEAFEVVGQDPFQAHFGVPPQRESPESHGLLDDSEDGLDCLLPQFVEHAAAQELDKTAGVPPDQAMRSS